MNNLLHANFARLWKNKVFWLGTAVLLLWSAGLLLGTSGQEEQALENYFFEYGPLMGGFCAVFISLFLGTDYSDGTIRNKIIVGHSRIGIYFSNLILCWTAVLMMNGVWMIGMLTLGTLMLGWFQCSGWMVLLYILVTIFMLLAFTSIFTLISMMVQNKSTSAVAALLVFLAVLFVGSYFNNRLEEPEIYSGGPVITAEGDSITKEVLKPERNPEYVGGNRRKIYEFMVDFLPTGQGIRIANHKAENIPRMVISSVFLAAAATAAGVTGFKRKDLL